MSEALYLTPQRCAEALAVSSEFIRGEIKGGRLIAIVLKRSSGRSVYRIDPDDFTAYVARYWQRALPGSVFATLEPTAPCSFGRSSLCKDPSCVGPKKCAACRLIYSRENRKRYSELNPEQRRKADARSIANTYQCRGKLIPQPCEVCGSLDTEKHHDDYDKPLQVRWFCREHHRVLSPRTTPEP